MLEVVSLSVSVSVLELEDISSEPEDSDDSSVLSTELLLDVLTCFFLLDLDLDLEDLDLDLDFEDLDDALCLDLLGVACGCWDCCCDACQARNWPSRAGSCSMISFSSAPDVLDGVDAGVEEDVEGVAGIVVAEVLLGAGFDGVDGAAGFGMCFVLDFDLRLVCEWWCLCVSRFLCSW